jgi:hypothetical protein
MDLVYFLVVELDENRVVCAPVQVLFMQHGEDGIFIPACKQNAAIRAGNLFHTHGLDCSFSPTPCRHTDLLLPNKELLRKIDIAQRRDRMTGVDRVNELRQRVNTLLLIERELNQERQDQLDDENRNGTAPDRRGPRSIFYISDSSRFSTGK